ncbi:hypothetical protein [Pseudomonas syringae]|uniref:hypothetical protein n=1 Tax=Pseudomonas syringae TaxID=317 RepID=UPI000A1FE9E8|nr:hypothetical protein [Pseudomonas syringae]OSN39512.1 hypothetical protein BV342_01223 [Pseudomonas syringae pv. actinidiae]OSR79968.1 hypothetical protein BV328_01665 [Pseudomonas syringae pv. actinidiae]
MSEIKERPILFNAPMVRAILSGQKTVTRRAIKFPFTDKGFGCELAGNEIGPDEVRNNCPYGVPGQRLWVRETWGVISHDFDEHGNMVDWKPDRPAFPIREMRFGKGYYSGHVIYRADGEAAWAGDDDGGGDDRSAWKPSIHMPRIASRLLLEVTDVRLERLQDLSEDQALVEGVMSCKQDIDPDGNDYSPQELFAVLWTMINGDGSWQSNPWVWVVEFKPVTP